MTARSARALRVLCLAAACASAPGGRPALAEDAPASAAPTIFKWVDTNGIAHYTTDLGRVPRSVRGSVRALGSGGASPGDSFAARDASPDSSMGPSAPVSADPSAPAPGQAEWDPGSAGAAAAAGPATPATPTADAAAASATFAATDRPAELATDEEPAAAPAQPASAAPAVALEPDAASSGDLEARIAALEAQIASDEEALKGFLAAPGPADPGQIAYDPSFREVAERLPKRLAELRTLQSERAQLDQP